MKHVEIYLVPGFLGFEKLAELDYYLDVAPLLREILASKHQIEAHIITTDTLPAGSLRKRALALAAEVAKHHDPAVASVHLVGHSTGGIDARMLLSPDAHLDPQHTLAPETQQTLDHALEATRTCIGLATPHYGTPMARLALQLNANIVLDQFAELSARVPLGLVRAGLRTLGVAAVFLGGYDPFLHWIQEGILGDKDASDALVQYLIDIGQDVGAMSNLTQEGMDLAGALLQDRPQVHYGSIVTGTNRPSFGLHGPPGLLLINTGLFRWAWAAAAHRNPDYPYAPDAAARLQSRLKDDRRAGIDTGALTVDAERTNDGIVPSASQLHGELLGVFASDHLDCVGHFPRTTRDGTRVSGWVRSGAGFTPERFVHMWSHIADFIAQHA